MQVNVLIEHGEELVGGFPIEELCTFVMKNDELARVHRCYRYVRFQQTYP